MDEAPQKPACSEFVEVDPTGRYGRYNDVLGRGASKTVYRAFDEYEGIEVAWNQVKLYDFLQSPVELERLYCEIHLLKTLKHKNIMKFYASWVDITKRNINFITEMFTSGTLKQYRQKHRRVNIRAVKHWCRQILRGLLYLHSHDPPVIHRDLKCDNIFINGNQGEVKIGDLGLAAFLRKSHAAHCVGTPEFMAPEVYEEDYNELVDIYSFGMCVLEMVTFEYPYSECTHPAQIYKKVISGSKPEALYKVRDPEVRQFVEKCLATASRRLPAKELLKDPFLQSDGYDPDVREVEPPLWQSSCSAHFRNQRIPCGFSSSLPHKLENGWGYNNLDFPGIHLFNSPKDEPLPNVDVTIKGRRREDGSIHVRLRITDKEGRIRNIHFPFDIEADTALSVADEMVSELDIIDYDVKRIAAMIDSEISSLVPGWRPGPGMEDTAGYPTLGICQNYSPNDSFRSLVNYGPGCNNTDGLHCSPLGCAAMHGRFEEFTFQADGSEQCKSKEAPAPSSSSEGLDMSLPSTPGSHSDEEREHMDEQARNVGSMLFSDGRKSLGRFCCGSSVNQQCSEMSKTSCRPHPPNLSHDQLNDIRQELRWHKAKHQMELLDYNSQQFEGSWRVLKLPSDLDYREHRRKGGSSVRPPQMCTAEALKSLHLGEKAYSFHHHPPIAVSPANGDGGLYWCSSHPNSASRSGRHCKVKHESNPETMFSVKDFYKGMLLLNCVPRTKSFPVDVVDA